MTRVVWKYELHPGGDVIWAPAGARIVHVGPFEPGSNAPAVWIERGEPDAPGRWRLLVIATGGEVPDGAIHVGSAWCGPYMWHVYRLDDG